MSWAYVIIVVNSSQEEKSRKFKWHIHNAGLVVPIYECDGVKVQGATLRSQGQNPYPFKTALRFLMARRDAAPSSVLRGMNDVGCGAEGPSTRQKHGLGSRPGGSLLAVCLSKLLLQLTDHPVQSIAFGLLSHSSRRELE